MDNAKKELNEQHFLRTLYENRKPVFPARKVFEYIDKTIRNVGSPEDVVSSAVTINSDLSRSIRKKMNDSFGSTDSYSSMGSYSSTKNENLSILNYENELDDKVPSAKDAAQKEQELKEKKELFKKKNSII